MLVKFTNQYRFWKHLKKSELKPNVSLLHRNRFYSRLNNNDDRKRKLEEHMKTKRMKDEKREEMIRNRRARMDKSLKKVKESLFSKAFFDRLVSLSVGSPKIQRPKSTTDQEFYIREDLFESVYKSVSDKRTSIFVILILSIILAIEELNDLYNNFTILGNMNVNILKRYFYEILTYDSKSKGKLSIVKLIPAIWWLKTTPFLTDVSKETDLVSLIVYLLNNEKSLSNLSRNYLHNIFYEIFDDDEMAYRAIQKHLISSLILSMKFYDIDPLTETFNFEPTLVRKILSNNERVEKFIVRGGEHERNEFTKELEDIITNIDKHPLTVSMLLAHFSSFPSFKENINDYEATIILDACKIMKNIKDEYIRSFSNLCISNLTDFDLKDIASVHSFDYEWRHPKLPYLLILPTYVYLRYRNFASWKGILSLRSESQKRILVPAIMKTSFLTFLLLYIHNNQKYTIKEFMEKIKNIESLEKYIPTTLKENFFKETRYYSILGLNKNQLNVILASCMNITVDIAKLLIIYIAPYILLPHAVCLGMSYQYTKYKRKVISRREYVSNKLK